MHIFLILCGDRIGKYGFINSVFYYCSNLPRLKLCNWSRGKDREGQYLNLDKDHNGMLSKEELSRYGTATMTNVFLDRVFQECLTYDGEMRKSEAATMDEDYKTYLDFVLALENRKEPAALQYIFKLLDIENKGYLNVFSLNYFFRDEIFDMVKPKDPLKISLQDLINSNQGDTVTTILIDLNGFWTYENREALVANDSENSADLDDT
ncbi:Serine/threonine-protein phosphatase 2A regulatory subunit B'' subunit gamma [Saguinus oedipus]|uniref:Serine/threonine-protein phosphatase 2A regulatory subunit B'' subunit gamma n=1 Tax=Saguinus oedipus TaxID=9490 RepID=A0ABQ9V3Y7_SAGOE|nr:Serine/threonine-protein phosphatase 2A regulatory subunit B'' subunit gamma [Saguinus oedipus]